MRYLIRRYRHLWLPTVESEVFDTSLKRARELALEINANWLTRQVELVQVEDGVVVATFY